MTYTLVLAPPRRKRLERQEPLHRLGRRRPHRQGPRRGASAAASSSRRPASCPTSCTRRCCAARSRPPTSRSTRPTGTGSRSSATGGSTSATTARCRARTRSRPSSSSARSSSCCGAAPTTCRRRPSTTDDEFSPARRPALRRARRRDAGAPSASRTSSRGCMPYWENEIQTDLADGLTVMVAAHGNSLRALVKTLDGISDDDIAGPQHPDRHAARLRARRRLPSGDPRRPLPRPRGRRARPPRPSPTRAADQPPRRASMERPRSRTRASSVSDVRWAWSRASIRETSASSAPRGRADLASYSPVTR